jgi:hypothetical protein
MDAQTPVPVLETASRVKEAVEKHDVRCGLKFRSLPSVTARAQVDKLRALLVALAASKPTSEDDSGGEQSAADWMRATKHQQDRAECFNSLFTVLVGLFTDPVEPERVEATIAMADALLKALSPVNMSRKRVLTYRALQRAGLSFQTEWLSLLWRHRAIAGRYAVDPDTGREYKTIELAASYSELPLASAKAIVRNVPRDEVDMERVKDISTSSGCATILHFLSQDPGESPPPTPTPSSVPIVATQRSAPETPAPITAARSLSQLLRMQASTSPTHSLYSSVGTRPPSPTRGNGSNLQALAQEDAFRLRMFLSRSARPVQAMGPEQIARANLVTAEHRRLYRFGGISPDVARRYFSSPSPQRWRQRPNPIVVHTDLDDPTDSESDDGAANEVEVEPVSSVADEARRITEVIHAARDTVDQTIRDICVEEAARVKRVIPEPLQPQLEEEAEVPARRTCKDWFLDLVRGSKPTPPPAASPDASFASRLAAKQFLLVAPKSRPGPPPHRRNRVVVSNPLTS